MYNPNRAEQRIPAPIPAVRKARENPLFRALELSEAAAANVQLNNTPSISPTKKATKSTIHTLGRKRNQVANTRNNTQAIKIIKL